MIKRMDGGVVAMVGAAMSGLIYLIRGEVKKEVQDAKDQVSKLDSRLSSHEAGCAMRWTGLERELREMHDRGERIEDKLDRALEHRG